MLELRSITKSFGPRRVLDAVSMTLHPGEITGFVGANGAGKTTTMRIVMGLVPYDAGALLWDGAPLRLEEQRTFGYMPEERGLYRKQPVREQLVYFGRLHGMSKRQAAQRADELLDIFGLTSRAGEKLEQLSLGNQQRVQIAVALMHRPRALILDEPFSGLDPDAVHAMAGLVRSAAAEGVPVLFSSHQLDLVERLCDQIVIISAGRIVAAGSADALRARHAPLMRLDAPAVGEWVHEMPGITVTEKTADRVVFIPETPQRAQAVLQRALQSGPVTHFAEVIRPLSEIYQEVTR